MKLFSKKNSNSLPRRRTAVNDTESQRSSESFTFQRNRTLTGSVSSRVTAINETNADMKSPRVHTHELTKKRRHLGLLLFMVLAISLALYGLVSEFTASVKIQFPSGVSAQNGAGYEKIIQDYFSSHPIERLRFLLNPQQLTSYMQSKAPEVMAVRQQGWAGFGSSEMLVIPRQPIAGWTMNGSQQYVDANGIAFSRNYYPAPEVQIIDKSGAQTQSGQTVASNRFLGFVGRVVGLSGEKGLKVMEVVIPVATTRQIEIRLEGYEYPIKLTSDRLVGEQVEDMARAIEWLRANKRPAQYVDVRVGGKAFYK